MPAIASNCSAVAVLISTSAVGFCVLDSASALPLVEAVFSPAAAGLDLTAGLSFAVTFSCTVTKGRIFSKRAAGMPVFDSSLTVKYGRLAMILLAYDGPMPGTFSNSAAVAVLISTSFAVLAGTGFSSLVLGAAHDFVALPPIDNAAVIANGSSLWKVRNKFMT